MTGRPRSWFLIAAGLAAAAVSAGCAESQPTRFYTLSSLTAAPGETPPQALPDLAVGVEPVILPPYLDRTQLVTRAGSNRVVLADLDSWAEPLDGLFTRVLAENLANVLGTDDVLLLPQRRLMPLDYQVEVDVTRFDIDTNGNAVLDARWWVLDREGERVLRNGRSTIAEPTQAGDHTASAAALSRALGGLSVEIAEAIADQAGT
jgi:uncharacterized protein